MRAVNDQSVGFDDKLRKRNEQRSGHVQGEVNH
jgi:hypothetical protein